MSVTEEEKLQYREALKLKIDESRNGLVITTKLGQIILINDGLAVQVNRIKGKQIRLRFIGLNDQYYAINRLEKAVPLG